MKYRLPLKLAVLRTALVGVLSFGFCALSYAEGITKEQGDAMLDELRQIRQLLSRQPAPQAQAPSAPAQAQKVRVKLSDNEYVLGSKEAPLVVVEFTDFQCPYCNRFYTQIFPELKKEYIDTGKMRFLTHEFPLDFHPQAMPAAMAARCAGEQGKYWEMKDALMTNSANLSSDLITQLARDRGLDMDKYKACVESGKYREQIAQEGPAARAIGINGTPSFVIGRQSGDYVEGYLVVGAQPFQNFDAVAKKLLAEGK
jgi:protein-disulfide isomerase